MHQNLARICVMAKTNFIVWSLPASFAASLRQPPVHAYCMYFTLLMMTGKLKNNYFGSGRSRAIAGNKIIKHFLQMSSGYAAT